MHPVKLGIKNFLNEKICPVSGLYTPTCFEEIQTNNCSGNKWKPPRNWQGRRTKKMTYGSIHNKMTYKDGYFLQGEFIFN